MTGVYDFCRAELPRREPDIWRRLHPRGYSLAAGYRPDLPAVALGGVCTAVKDGLSSDPSAKLASVVAGQLARHAVPTWHVGRDLLLALDRTDPPEGVRWTDTPFPFPAGVLLLPAGACVDTAGRGYGWVAWCRVAEGEEVRVPGQPTTMVMNNAALLVVTATADDPTFPTLLQSYSAAEWPSVRLPAEVPDLPGDVMTETESDVVRRLAVVALNAILVLNARPDLAESGAVTAKGRSTKKGGLIPDTWSPNWLGRAYARPRGTADGTHAGPRLHWRRGHFRRQPTGLGRAERVTIWIEPTLVGGSE